MRITTLFILLAAAFVGSLLGLGALVLQSLEQSRLWDQRVRLAQESYGLHQKLESNIFRLFKQHGDALLIGDRDGGEGERALSELIKGNLADIREVIAREIHLAGEEEIEELALLDLIQADVERVTKALASFNESGERIETKVQIESLATLLDREIDVTLTRRIEQALSGEQAEVDEVQLAAEAFRESYQRVVIAFVLLSLAVMIWSAHSFNRLVRKPLATLPDRLSSLRQGRFADPMALEGAIEFKDLGEILGEVAQGLARLDASHAQTRRELEASVETRTRELQALVLQLETGDANRKRLMADISHELRTPLTIIRGEADVALRTVKDIPKDLSDTLARIRDAARHTNQIVDDMLTVARQEAGQLRLNRQETDCRVILEEAADMFPQAVILTLPPEPVRGLVDKVRLRQAILALFQNARRHGGPTIGATLCAFADKIRITVDDDGPGMSGEEKRQAFERFFRGSNAAAPDHEGSGLGLPIVKSIVVAHGGDV